MDMSFLLLSLYIACTAANWNSSVYSERSYLWSSNPWDIHTTANNIHHATKDKSLLKKQRQQAQQHSQWQETHKVISTIVTVQ